jgi:hypothetical protein
MKLFVTTLIAALTVVGTAAGQDEPKTISKDVARKAIALFCADPLSADADGAAAIILKFAEASPNVVINLTPKACPWLKDKATPVKYSAKLLGAYVAGNVKSQLASGQTKNDSYSGVLQVIATYHQIQKREPDFKRPEVEHLIELESQKKLKEYLESRDNA